MSRHFEAHIVPKGLLMRRIHWFRLLLLCVCLSMVRCEADEGVLLSVADQSGAEVSQRFKLRMRAPPKTGPTSQPGVYVFKFHDDVTLK